MNKGNNVIKGESRGLNQGVRTLDLQTKILPICYFTTDQFYIFLTETIVDRAHQNNQMCYNVLYGQIFLQQAMLSRVP